MKVFGIYSNCTFSHMDCLVLLSAESADDAISEVLKRTDIDCMFNEENLQACEMFGLSADDCYIHVFADDINVL